MITTSLRIRTAIVTTALATLTIGPLPALAAGHNLTFATTTRTTASAPAQRVGSFVRDRSPKGHIRDAAQCPSGQWIGFTHSNVDINAFYDGNTGSGPNGCEVQDNAVTIPESSAGVPAGVTVPAGTVAQVNQVITVASGGTLIVPAGDSLLMESNRSVFVQSGGKLNLAGTGPSASGLVTVKSPTESPGNWSIIDYQKGSSGSVRYAVIDDGGYSGADGNGNAVYAELVIEGVNISVTHSQFMNSYGNGIEITQGGNPTLTGDTFSYSTNSGFGTSSGSAVQYDFVPGVLTKSVSGLTSTGYGNNDVQIGIDGSPAGSFVGKGSWPNAGVPYRVGVDVDVASGSSLTIPAGVTVLMRNSSVYVQSGGTLVLAGTAALPVTFTSANDFKGSTRADQPGDWGAIDYRDGSAGSISNSVIKDGGSSISGSANSLYADVAIEGVGSLVSISNSKIENSYGNGIELTDHAKASLISDTFTYCTSCSFGTSYSYAVRFDFAPSNLMSGTGSSATPLLRNLTSSGYGTNAIYIAGSGTSNGNFSGNGTWPNAEMPYSLDGDLHVTARQTLTIGPGVTFRMNGGLYADNNGHLTIAGTATQPVTFTSRNDFALSSTSPAPGDWTGIDYETGSTGTVTYAVVKYGGGATADGYGDLVISNVKSGFSVTDSKFLHSYSSDVHIVNGGKPHLNRDQLGAVASENYGVQNSSTNASPKVDASRDYWSSQKGPKGTAAPASTGVNTTPWYSNSNTASTAGSKPATAAVLKAFGAKGSIGANASGGAGGIAVDTFASNPTTSTAASNAVTYFDVRTDSRNTFKSVLVKDCDSTKGQSLVYYNGSGWQLLPKTTRPDAKGCVSFTLTSTSTPTRASLKGNGVPFAAVLPATVTKTLLTSSAAKNATTYGSKVQLKATVTAANRKPRGAVTFYSGKARLGAKNLAGGKAITTVSNLTPGKDSLTAIFTPSSGSGFAASTSTALKLTVNPAPVMLSYTGPTSIKSGKAVTLSASLKSTSNVAISGRVIKISLGSQTCTTSQTNKRGIGSCAISKVNLKKGPAKVTVKFAGDPKGSKDFYEAGLATKNVAIT